MTYKVVRNAQGEVVCFGPDDGMYEPTVQAGSTLSIEDTEPHDYIGALQAAAAVQAAVQAAAKKSAHAKLTSLGLTADEIAGL